MFVCNSLKYVCFLASYLSFWINHGIFISLKPNYFPRVYSTTIILWEDLRRIYVPILAKTLHPLCFLSALVMVSLDFDELFRKWKPIEYRDYHQARGEYVLTKSSRGNI